MKWTDKVKEFLIMHKTTIAHMAIPALVAILIMSIVVVTQTTTKAKHAADIGRLDGEMAAMTNHVVGITNDVGTIKALGPLATKAGLSETQGELDTVAENVTSQATSISALQTRMGTAEDRIQEARDDIATLSATPPEGYLTGAFGDYTLHAIASEAGNFTANVYLCYASPIAAGNTTYEDALQAFYGTVDFDATSVWEYIPMLSYNGTDWQVVAVSFNIGTFALEAKVEKSIEVAFGGLGTEYEPDFAYVEVWPTLKE